jgi:hypothetical protein
MVCSLVLPLVARRPNRDTQALRAENLAQASR